jgi:GT2 family glycosyltransferase
MSTYAAETAEHLSESLESVYAQTRAPDQFVLVVDGPVPPPQEEVIHRYHGDNRIPRFTLVRLTENAGAVAALNAGLQVCEGDFTMRMDPDDICSPDRLSLQLSYAVDHSEIDVVSSWVEEFSDDGRKTRLSVSPIDHEHVTAALRWRNVLAPPAILVKTLALREVGGYRSKFGTLEDYDLFVRLALKGCRFHVIPKVLLRFRTGVGQDGRVLRNAIDEIAFRLEFWRAGFLRLKHLIAAGGFSLIIGLPYAAIRKCGHVLVFALAFAPQGNRTP